ncbi:transposable element Tcb1 transposase [Trichonephila clavipes]|uniref:Transposable element Tcb1 transposase n=1 Tax=Trichonephila clavipes TaxID=2585209 RepID=A0A8X7BHV8_TRICX|nr:transposable element Tcb1 transposase [Trichonephila clavipes]
MEISVVGGIQKPPVSSLWLFMEKQNEATEAIVQDSKEGYDGRSHPPQCTTSLENRLIVRMEVRDHSVISRTIAQHIESVMHHSVSARNIRRRLKQSGLSASRSLRCLPLTQNHSRLQRQWCDERRMWVVEWNDIVFIDESRICLQHHDDRI